MGAAGQGEGQQVAVAHWISGGGELLNRFRRDRGNHSSCLTTSMRTHLTLPKPQRRKSKLFSQQELQLSALNIPSHHCFHTKKNLKFTLWDLSTYSQSCKTQAILTFTKIP